MNYPNARTNPCKDAGRKVVSGRARRGDPLMQYRCPACGRWVPVNYNGTLRWHKAEVKRN